MKIYDATLKFTLVREDTAPKYAARPEQVAAYMADAFEEHPEQESFYVLILTRKHAIKARHLISLGIQNATLCHPREVFRAAVLHGASAIVCVHNHPSGDPAPSAADVQMTRQLREASRALDIDLLDHVIIGSAADDPLRRGFYSFREAGLL